MRDIGKNIRDIRTAKGMTQEEMATGLFVSRQTVSNYEMGRTRPDVEMLIRIAEILDTDLYCLIYEMPSVKRRRIQYAKLTIAAGVMVVMFLVHGWIGTKTHMDYGSLLYFWNLCVIKPAAYLALGWTLCSGVIRMSQIKIGNWAKKPQYSVFMLVTIAIYIILVMPYLVPAEFHIPIVWQKILGRILGLTGSFGFINNALFAFIMGTAFCCISLKKRETFREEKQIN